MKKWERRLGDLAYQLQNVIKTYFDPELFRRNVNQFLTISRTVTFLIQKNKSEIKDFDNWYRGMLSGWTGDDVMTWARDARNFIEKEGDLEINSLLRATLIFSYVAEEDVTVDINQPFLVYATTQKLIRLARQRLPTGVSDAASVKIERRWVTTSLPNWELLHALIHVYARIYEGCVSLANHLGHKLPQEIQRPSLFENNRNDLGQTSYVKLNSTATHHVATELVAARLDAETERRFRDIFGDNPLAGIAAGGFDTVFENYRNFAEQLFNHDKHHIHILMLLDENFHPFDQISTVFTDQADKFIFWRLVGERVASTHARGIIWIAELWLRTMDRSGATPIRNMPIVGEQLNIMGLSRAGDFRVHRWTIKRDGDGDPTLEHTAVEGDESFPFFLHPVRVAMGLI